ncbi:MAG TPA: hypothetical protein VGG43_01995 [Acidimicrobiales bacterium]|jgi:hypothetical protein
MAECIDRRSFLARGAVTGAWIVALGAGGGLLDASGAIAIVGLISMSMCFAALREGSRAGQHDDSLTRPLIP